jgi:signal transduction histidine kinase
VKISSTARLRILAIVITTLLTAGISTYAAIHTHDRDRRLIDQGITEVVRAATENPQQELSAALFYLDQYSLDLSLHLLSRDGQLTTINSSTSGHLERISLSQARSASGAILQDDLNRHYRLKTLEISGGDFLVVSGSTFSADENLKSNLRSAAIATVGANLLAFIVLSFYIGLIRRRDEQDALSRMQEFLGDASQELRTPLTVVKGYVEMLSKSMFTEEKDKERAFVRVNTEILRMESLIRDLLLLAELGESASRDYELFDISELVQSHVDDFSLLNPQRDVESEIQADIQIEAARDFISRFMQNGLNNIARHTPNDAPVKVTLKQMGKKLTLNIEDGGAGLPESAYREKVQSLHRFDKSRSRENGGSGLGLSIMAAVITRLGGEFNLQKSSLGGLQISAELPLKQ